MTAEPENIVLRELRALRADMNERLIRVEEQLSAMRSEIDGGFHMMRGTDGRVEGLRMIVDAQGQRITALERKP
jgi:hypothetical protein